MRHESTKRVDECVDNRVHLARVSSIVRNCDHFDVLLQLLLLQLQRTTPHYNQVFPWKARDH